MKKRIARKRTAFKFESAVLRPPVIHSIATHGLVSTDDGVMELVSLRFQTELRNPENDIAALVGKIDCERTVDTEIWFWRDKFWLKAIDSNNMTYYHHKQFLFYEINPEDFGFTAEQALSAQA